MKKSDASCIDAYSVVLHEIVREISKSEDSCSDRTENVLDLVPDEEGASTPYESNENESVGLNYLWINVLHELREMRTLIQFGQEIQVRKIVGCHQIIYVTTLRLKRWDGQAVSNCQNADEFPRIKRSLADEVGVRAIVMFDVLGHRNWAGSHCGNFWLNMTTANVGLSVEVSKCNKRRMRGGNKQRMGSDEG